MRHPSINISFSFLVCGQILFLATILQLKVAKRRFFENLSLEPCMDVLGQTLIRVIDSTVHYNTEDEWKEHLLNISQSNFQCILTSNSHINCLVLRFAKAIVCCTGKCSCISPVDVCYSQRLSFLHHISFPSLFFGPSDVWFWSTWCFTG